MAWPTRNQQGPDFWDDDLKGYIDGADQANAAAASSAQTSANSAQGRADEAYSTAASAYGTSADALFLAQDAIPKSMGNVESIVKITQSAYDALGTKVATRLYIIVG